MRAELLHVVLYLCALGLQLGNARRQRRTIQPAEDGLHGGLNLASYIAITRLQRLEPRDGGLAQPPALFTQNLYQRLYILRVTETLADGVSDNTLQCINGNGHIIAQPFTMLRRAGVVKIFLSAAV